MKRFILAVFFVLFFLCPGLIQSAPSGPPEQRQPKKEAAITRIGESYTLEQGKTAEGDVVVIGGNLDIEGTVHGNVVCILGNLTLGPGAVISQDVTEIGGELSKDPNAIIKGNETIIARNSVARFLWGLPILGAGLTAVGLFFRLLSYLAYIALLVLVFVLFPSGIQNLSEEIRKNPWGSFGGGVLGIIAVFPLALLLILSCIGIPLVFLEIVLLIAGFVAGHAGASLFAGERFGDVVARAKGQPPLVRLIIGSVILGMVSLIPIFGKLIWLAASIFGFGACVVVLWKKWRSPRASSAPA